MIGREVYLVGRVVLNSFNLTFPAAAATTSQKVAELLDANNESHDIEA